MRVDVPRGSEVKKNTEFEHARDKSVQGVGEARGHCGGGFWGEGLGSGGRASCLWR